LSMVTARKPYEHSAADVWEAINIKVFIRLGGPSDPLEPLSPVPESTPQEAETRSPAHPDQFSGSTTYRRATNHNGKMVDMLSMTGFCTDFSETPGNTLCLTIREAEVGH
jgi:hypothetical protein